MTAIVLFGHGSRDPAWRRPMDAVADRIAQLAPGTMVVCAFLELQQPDLPTAMAQLAAAGTGRVT
ncbi:MAG TPA: CbiX/SirB N-terminal domain-containing protein, partial [Ramlibacter sp.]|nr:CbiX/SirB N-terminal domain-containing protein [Ramlibacter sp.]